MVFWAQQNRLSLEQECELLKSMGFGVELWPNMGSLDECRYDRRNWPRLKAATEGMLVSMRSRNDNPTIEQWAEQIECAKLLKANIVADLQSLDGRQGQQVEDWDYLAEVVRMADEHKVKLCVETGSLDFVKEVAKRFESIWHCLDTGYASLDSDHSFKEYVDTLARKVAHLHLTDTNHRPESHRPLGCTGGIPRKDWDYILQALGKYDNDVIASIEMTPCTPVEMIRRSSCFLFDVLGWPEKPPKPAKTGSKPA